MTFIDYKFYLNEDGDVSFDDDPDLGIRIGIKEGDLLRVNNAILRIIVCRVYTEACRQLSYHDEKWTTT